MTTVAHTNHTATIKAKFLHRALWAAQLAVGLSFVMAGSMKTTAPYVALAESMSWVSAVPEGLVRIIGISELLGGLGLIVPAATRIEPWLTPLAGVGLTLVMILAVAFHLSRGEAAVAAVNLALGGLAAFITWGRARRLPIRGRDRGRERDSFTL